MMAARDCPLCGVSHGARLFAEARLDPRRLNDFSYSSRKSPEYMHLRLLHCPRCELVYADSPPDVATLANAYRDAAFDSQAESSAASESYLRALQVALAGLESRRAALDIGAGDGAFLHALLKQGWQDVHGLEPSSAPILAASEAVRSRIRQGLFEPGQYPAGRFSLVTCFQTIEHVPDPLGLCQEAYRLLTPGGILCLVGHNRRALSARLLGRHSPIYDLEHLQLFCPRSFQTLLTRSGFQAIEVRTFWNTYRLSYWTRLFPWPGPLKRALLAGLEWSRVGRVRLSLPAGNLVAWGVKPPLLSAPRQPQ